MCILSCWPGEHRDWIGAVKQATVKADRQRWLTRADVHAGLPGWLHQ
jgi:hypothetical protein